MTDQQGEEKEKKQKPEVKLDKEELQILIQVLNQPRQQDLATAQRLILLSNKLSGMMGNM